MILSDQDIYSRLAGKIIPYKPEQQQPASYDVTIGPEILVSSNSIWTAPIDPDLPSSSWDKFNLAKGEIILLPGQFALGHTVERVEIPHDIVATLDGKSSRGRIGLMVHSTAGYIDPGFSGQVTLELYNLNNRGIIIRYGMRIGQLRFQQLSSEVTTPYGHPDLKSRYHGQMGATCAKREQT